MLKYERLNSNNLDLALKIQSAIFPDCDGTVNFLVEIDQTLFEKVSLGFQDYKKTWLVFLNNECIGLTGLYGYNMYPEDVWVGWFGVIEKYRRKGYAREILKWTGEKAKEDGFKNMRLYTYTDEDLEAVSFYRAVGMLEEKYSYEDVFLPYKISIFSTNLSGQEPTFWNNKNVYLYRQYLMEQDVEDIRSIEEMDKLYKEKK